MIHIDFLKDLDRDLISELSAASKLELTLEDFERMARYSEPTISQEAMLRELVREAEPRFDREALLRELVREAEPRFDREALLRELVRTDHTFDTARTLAESVTQYAETLSSPALDAMRLLTDSIVEKMATLPTPALEAERLLARFEHVYQSALSSPALDAANLLTRIENVYQSALSSPALDAANLLTRIENVYRGGAIPWDFARNIPGVSYTPELPQSLPPTPYTPSYTPSKPNYDDIGPFRGPMSQIKKVEAFMLAVGIPPNSQIWQTHTLEDVLKLAEAYESDGAMEFRIMPAIPQRGRGRRAQEEYQWAFSLIAIGKTERQAFDMMIAEYNIVINDRDDEMTRFEAFRQAMKRRKGKYRI